MAAAEDAESCRNHQLVWPLWLGDSLTGGHGTFWEIDLSASKQTGGAGEFATKGMRIPARCRPPNAHSATGDATRRLQADDPPRKLGYHGPNAEKSTGQRATRRTFEEFA